MSLLMPHSVISSQSFGFATELRLIDTKNASRISKIEVLDDSDSQSEIENEHTEKCAQRPLVEEPLEAILDVGNSLPFTLSQSNAQPCCLNGEPTSVEGLVPTEVYDQMKRICKRHDVSSLQSLLAALHAFLIRCTDHEGQKTYTIRAFIQGVSAEYSLKLEYNGFESFNVLIQEIISCNVQLLGNRTLDADCTLSFQASTSSGLWNSISTDHVALEFFECPEEGLRLRFICTPATSEVEDMQRFLDNFITLLSKVVANPDKSLLGVPLCGDKELYVQRHFYWSSNTTPNTWNNVAVIDRILQMAREYPQATAIITSDGEALTYAELMRRAHVIASSLQQSGSRPGDLIGLLCRPGLDEIAGMVAILLSRCAYVGMDPTFATERLSFMANDSQMRIILVAADLTELGFEVSLKSPSSPRILPYPKSYSGSCNWAPLAPSQQDPFYVIYTSGSTGSPKGVVLTQSNTQQMLSTLHHDYNFSRYDRFLHHSSMCFDLSVVEIFSALTCGATVCIASAHTKGDPEALGHFMKQVSITITYFTPTKFALLLEACQESLQQCQEYRIAFFAGERLPARIIERFNALQLRATMYNTWSPSELVVQTAIHKVPNHTAESKINIPIGFPIANCAHYIVDSNLNPVPVGVVGEICVGGAQVGRGYINQPEERCKAFTMNPFASDEYIRNGWTKLFRTGDRGRFLRNGELEFHGRIAGDKQIKLRGFRIDLGEVEQRIFEASKKGNFVELIDVNVTARPIRFRNIKEESITDDRQLIAFLVPATHLEDSERQGYVNAVHRALQAHLNSYMLPNGYEILESLPMTIGGKVDIRNLQSRDLDLLWPSSLGLHEVDSASTVAKEHRLDPVILTIIEIFRTSLSLAKNHQLTAEDNFFDLGGQSVLVLRLQAKLKTSFGVKLPLPSLFKDATPAAIAQMVRDKQTDLSEPIKALVTAAEDQIDWRTETVLPHEEEFLAPKSVKCRPRSEISTVLVTGADSFIGIHLISTILTTAPSMTIYFLGSSQPTALADLKINLGRYQLLNESWSELSQRLIPIGGTLAEPRFGLTQTQFSALGKKLHAIYHTGGEVSLLKSYHDLRRLNISSTLTLISLAHHGSYITELHYLSSWSVPHLQTWHDTRLTKSSITRAEEPSNHFTPSPSGSHGGYLKTRWASEVLLTRASHRGFRVSLYRGSAVTGSSATQVPEPMYDLYRYTIMRIIQTGCIPDTSAFTSPLPFAVDFIPVDYLASTMFALSLAGAAQRPDWNPENTPAIHHIGNPAPLLLNDLLSLVPKVLQQENVTLRVLPLEEWLLAIATGLAAGEELRIAAIRELFAAGHCPFSLDMTRTAATLARMKKGEEAAVCPCPCPPVGVEYLRRMIASSW